MNGAWVNTPAYIEYVRKRVADMLIDIGFQETTVKFVHKLPDGTESETAYRYGPLHCLITFVTWNDSKGVLRDWVLIEYADNLNFAQYHIYEDGDMIPIDVGIETIISWLRQEVEKAVRTLK